jgi:hypothetical protein
VADEPTGTCYQDSNLLSHEVCSLCERYETVN